MMQAETRTRRTLGINGLGRIGKLTLWHHVGRRFFENLVVNLGRPAGGGLADVVQTIEKDTTYGLMHRFLYGYRASPLIEIVDEEAGELAIDGLRVRILRQARNPRDIDWRAHGVKLVVDATGVFRDPATPADARGGALRGHLEAGAMAVIASAPFRSTQLTPPDDATMLIYGINHTVYEPTRHRVLSAASCTTTALAHMVKPLLEDHLTRHILTASMSTVHAVTNTQSTLDSVPKAGAKDLRKSRSMLNNIILTSTGAADALEQVIPEVRDIGFMADSVRVPTSTESLIILNCTFLSQLDALRKSSVSRESLLRIYRDAESGPQRGLLKVSDVQNVSTDLIGTDAAVVLESDALHTRTGVIRLELAKLGVIAQEALAPAEVSIPVTHAKIFGWYDNEFGSYVNRMGDLTWYVYEQLVG